MRISVVTRLASIVAGLATVLFLTLPSSAQIQNPIKAARDAYNKSRQQQQQQQQTQQPAQQQTRPAQTPQAGAAPAAANAPAAEAWTPPLDNSDTAPVTLDPSKMPDVLGVRIGMTPQQALDALRKQYPRDMYQRMPVSWWPAVQKPDYGYNILSSEPGNQPDAYLSFTAPPDPQVVWRMTRFTRRMHINRTTLLAALREKYGKETAAALENGTPSNDESRIAQLFWLFDEQGGRLPPTPSGLPRERNFIGLYGHKSAAGDADQGERSDTEKLVRSVRGYSSLIRFPGDCGEHRH